MTKSTLLAASALAMTFAAPAWAQQAATDNEAQVAQTDIVVTAQRQAQRLQDVPIAVSAFNAENLEKQQIVNPSALQQTLPNVTFTKTNFTSSSFTIRGIGDLCVGTTCDSATAIHVNDMPLLNSRLFESEFFDLSASRCCAGHRAPCSAATPLRAWSTSSPPSLISPASTRPASSNMAIMI